MMRPGALGRMVSLLLLLCSQVLGDRSLVFREWYLASPLPNPPFEPGVDYVNEARHFIRPIERYQVTFWGPMRDAAGEILEPSPWGLEEDRLWEVGWEPKVQEGPVFDLGAHTPIRNYVTSYLMTYLKADESCEAWFHAGSHDEVRLFMDGALLLTISNELPEQWREGHARVDMEAGDHTVLVKVLGTEGKHDVRVCLTVDGEGEEIPVRHSLAPSLGEFWCDCVGLAGVDAMGGNLVAFLDEPQKEVSDRAPSLHLQAATAFPISAQIEWSLSGPDGEMTQGQPVALDLDPGKATSFSLPIEWKGTGWHVLSLRAEPAEGATAGELVGEVDIPFLVVSDSVFRRRSRDKEDALQRMRVEAMRRDRLIRFLESDRDVLRGMLREQEVLGAERKAGIEETLETFQPERVGRIRLSLGQGWEAAWGAGDEAPEEGWFAPPSPVPQWQPEAREPLWLRTWITSPKGMEEAGARLILDGASHRVRVWCNGQSVGEGFGDFTSLTFDLDPVWKVQEENELCLRLESASSAAGTENYLGRWERPFLHEDRVGLLAEPVLLFHPKFWVERAPLQGSCRDGEIQFSIRVANQTQEKTSCLLEMLLLWDGKILSKFPWCELELEPGEARDHTLSIPWPRERFWPEVDPEVSARLFHLAASLRTDPAGPPRDQETFRFGVSRLVTRGTRLALNGREIRMRSVLLSPSAHGLSSRDWVELVRVLTAKGANALVLHGCTELQLSLADEMNVLVQPYMTPPGRHLVENEQLWEKYKELTWTWAETRIDHPCIVSWSTDDGLTGLLDQDMDLDKRLLEVNEGLKKLDEGRIVDHRGCPSSWWMDGFDVAHFSDRALCDGALFGWEGRYGRPVFVDEAWPWQEPGGKLEELRRRLRTYEVRKIPCVTMVPSPIPSDRLLEASHALPTDDVWSPAADPVLPRRSFVSVRVVHAGLPASGLWVGLDPGPGCTGKRWACRTDKEGTAEFLCEPGSWTAACLMAEERVETSFSLEAGKGWTGEPYRLELDIP